MNRFDELRIIVKGWVGKQDESDRAIAFIDELEATVKATNAWFEREDFVPIRYQDREIVINVGPVTRSLMAAVKKAAS